MPATSGTAGAPGSESSSSAENEEVRLRFPAEAEYGHIARITAAGLALRLGYTYAEVEDLRLALDEALVLLLRPEGGAGTVSVTFTPEGDRVVVEASTTAGDGQHWLDAGAQSRFEAIVTGLVDELEVDEEARSVRLVKQSRPREP